MEQNCTGSPGNPQPVKGNALKGFSEYEAIEGLHQSGAHFVLTNGKIPAWTKYLDRRPSMYSINTHLNRGPDHQVGIVPASIDSTVLDVDRGNPRQVSLAIGYPRVALDSKSREGSHLYYDDDRPRGNAQFQIAGCSGDIRSGKGFVVLYPGQHCRLHEALTRDGQYPIQTSLFDRIKAPAQPREKSRQKNPDPGGRLVLPDDVSEQDLKTCQHGQRDQMLFDVGRRKIYPLNIPEDLDEWVIQCRGIIEDLNQLIPLVPGDPINPGKIAYSIATWTFDRFGHVEHVKHDHSFNAQFRRGVKRHYGDATAGRQAMIRARNGKICDLYSIGWSQARIASLVELSQPAISGILAKSVMYGHAPVDRRTVTESAPWENEGISRAWWYRKRSRE